MQNYDPIFILQNLIINMRLVKKCVICGRNYIGFEKYCNIKCLEKVYN